MKKDSKMLSMMNVSHVKNKYLTFSKTKLARIMLLIIGFCPIINIVYDNFSLNLINSNISYMEILFAYFIVAPLILYWPFLIYMFLTRKSVDFVLVVIPGLVLVALHYFIYIRVMLYPKSSTDSIVYPFLTFVETVIFLIVYGITSIIVSKIKVRKILKEINEDDKSANSL